MEWDFLSPLRNEEALAQYHSRVRRNNELTIRNRKRMNFSADRALKVYSEVFAEDGIKDVYIFGAGRLAERGEKPAAAGEFDEEGEEEDE
mgnify:CR=1 FL=1